MALTKLTAKLNAAEFSRFESARRDLKVRVLTEPAIALADTIRVSILRKNDSVVAFQDIVLTGDYAKGVVAQFDLSSITEGGIPLMIRGEYKVQVEDIAEAAPAVTVPFLMSLITVDQLKKTYCMGLTLRASEVCMPVKQPRLVTGVTVTATSEATKPGLAPLVYVAAVGDVPATLQWGNGAIVELDESVTSEILPDEYGAYIEVDIDFFELPDVDTDEAIFIDQDKMTDDALRSYIDSAVVEMENDVLSTFLEPLPVATEPFFSAPAEGEYFARKATMAPYYIDAFNMNVKAWHVSLPHQHVQRIDTLEGIIGNADILSITSGTYAVNALQGTIDVLPHDSQYAFLFNFHAQMRLYGRREVIPDFWRYKGFIGLEPELDILKAIGYKAAMPILTVAGQAYRAGYSSESISKDGVSVSKGYTSSAVYGIYSATIGDYEKWLKENLKRLKARHKGLMMTVL